MSIGNIVTNVQACRTHLQSCVDGMKIVTSLHDGATPSQIGMSLLRLLCRYGKSIPYLGVLLASVEGMLPDEDSKDVVCLLKNLRKQIGEVRADINRLENQINLQAVRLQYNRTVDKIKFGMKILVKISMSTDNEKERHEDRLKELCSRQTMTLAIETLLDGLTSGEDLLQNDILETIYLVTRGHRGKIDLMCIRFIQLVIGGLSIIAAYETLVRGEEGALDMKNWFDDDTVEKLETRFEAYRQRCKDCFRENMLEDLNDVLDGDKSTKDAAADLSKFLLNKYDWLETYSIVCKESNFIDYDFHGDHVKSLKRNGRFGVIFYRERLEDPALRMFPMSITPQASRLNQARQIIRETDKDCWFSDAARINSVLKDSLSRKGFRLWGCATVKANRLISIPLINIAALVKSNKALDCFVISGTWTKAISDVGGHKHLCLLK